MNLKLLLVLLLLTVDATASGIDEINNMVGRPPPALTAYGFKDISPWTTWNKIWFASAIGGQIADVVSTEIQLGDGCSEANPIGGSSQGLIYALKVALLGGAYYITDVQYKGDPKQQDIRNYIYAPISVMGFGVAGYNMSLECD